MPKIGLLLRTYNLSFVKIARALSKELASPIISDVYINDEYDIIIALDSTSKYTIPLAKAKVKGIVTAAFIHDIRSISHTPIVVMDSGVNPPTIQRLRRLTSLNLIKPFIDKVLTPSQASANNIQKYVGGLNACVVPLGIDHDVYKPINTSKREILGIKFQDDEYLILTVATKKHIIRHAVAIFSRARERLRKARLIVRGGPCDKSLKGIKGLVCLPPLPEELMPRLYSIADVFLYPSLIEGFGLPILEAMSCGLPVVAYRRMP